MVSGPDVRGGGVASPNFSCLVQTVLGGSVTSFFVKSPCTPQIM